MIAFDPESSRLLDRTGVCGARRGTLSKREKVTGRAFDRQIGSTKRGIAMQTAGSGPGSPSTHICYATGDRMWSSRESRINGHQG